MPRTAASASSSSKEKKLKSSLVRTRNAIKRKFQKLHTEKETEERNLKKKYEPITNTLKQLIDIKDGTTSKSKSKSTYNEFDNHDDDDLSIHSYNNDNNDGSKVDDDYHSIHIEDVDDDNDDHQSERSHRKEAKKRVHTPTSEHSNKIPRNASKRTFISAKARKKPTRRSNVSRKSTLSSLQEYGSNDVIDDMDVDYGVISSHKRIRHPDDPLADHNLKLDTKVRKRMLYDNTDADGESDTGNEEWSRKFKMRQKKQQQLYDLQDTRDTGLEKMKNKITPDNVEKPSHLVEVSPQDYDIYGNYRGKNKPKRSKVQIKKDRFKDRVGRYNERRSILISDDETDGSDTILFQSDYAKDFERQRKKVKGKGWETNFIPYNDNIVYEYYDDPNELCDRLRLLISSKQAGNSNHNQEINSIIEELRELDIIV